MIYDSENITITTERLRLRFFQESDAQTVSEMCNNYNIYKSTLNLPYPYTLECALWWIRTHKEKFETEKAYEFAITDKESGALYGAVGLFYNKPHDNGEIGYWVGEDFWGKGYATEASKAILEFAFDVKGFHKVFARHFISNPASGKVMENIGMNKEGVLKDHIKKEGRYHDLALYGIIRNS